MTEEHGAVFIHEGPGAGGYSLIFRCVLLRELETMAVIMPPDRVSEIERYRLNTEARKQGYVFHDGILEGEGNLHWVAIIPPHWDVIATMDCVNEACGFHNAMIEGGSDE